MKKSKRRANNEGTVFRRASGQWIVQITIENLDGTKTRRSRNAKSQAHGQIILAELREKYRLGATESGKLTIEELANRWMKSTKGDDSTIYGRKLVVDKRILPQLGKRKCDDVTVDIVERWCEEIQRTGYDRETETFTAPLGLRSQQVAFDTLSAIFSYGARRKLVAFNPCESEIRPRPPESEISPFFDDEVKKILQEVRGDRLEAMHHLAFAIGLRQGELFGLQWKDINWEHATIRIERQARDHKGKVTIKMPKTKGSCRTVSLPVSVINQLQNRRKLAMKEGRAQPSDFIFTTPQGFVIRRTTFGKRVWRPLLGSLGIQHRGHHHVRHTAATTMLREGTAVHIVSHILGHSNSGTTQKTYAHYIPGDGKIAAGTMERVLNRLTS
ncbi:tyrosine-type recombinase/integrase [Planctomicrobium sp. SH668]|uniref:tyrosine-type recombinase/integrase n=1 Tax=Planctomicrobium sp. SH668 TaxID=3448126 RepID=UPI003F5BBF4A